MKKNGKTIIGLLIAFIIGISTTVTAATVFNSKDITYSSDKTTKKNVKDALDELYNKAGKCPDGKWCYNEPMTLADKVELGDYISMTPTSTSYKPKSEDTGCMDDKNCTQNTINPSELNLWRVIRKNDDGTVDAISEYVSSKEVRFFGKKGYMNFIGGLNEIAKQYINEKYVQSTRNVGYDNQIERCSEFSDELCPKDISSDDEQYIERILGKLRTTKPDGSLGRYWFSFRIGYRSIAYGKGYWIADSCSVGNGYLRNCGFISFGMVNGVDESDGERQGVSSIRPILTFKPSLEIASGNGKSASTAYTFK